MKALAPLALALALALAGCVNVSSQDAMAEPMTFEAADDRHTAYMSTDSFAVVEQRLRAGIAARPLTLFTVVDHGQGARDAGMSIGQSKLFLVGNPEVGTPFMMADPQMGLDLPLKILIHDAPGGTHMAYSHPGVAAQKHGVLDEVRSQVDMIHDTMAELMREAGGTSLRMIED